MCKMRASDISNGTGNERKEQRPYDDDETDATCLFLTKLMSSIYNCRACGEETMNLGGGGRGST